MRSSMLALLATTFLVALPEPAEARRGGSEHQDLLFVAETKIIEEGVPYSLCLLVNERSAFGINLFRSVETYALAENKCDTTAYYPMSVEDIAEAKEAGMIDAAIPNEPKLSTSDLITGHIGWLLVAGVLAFAGYGALNARKRRQERQGMMGEASPAAVAILDAMCHAAKADGHIDASEIAAIADAAERMTGESFDPGQVARMAELAEGKPSDKDFKRLVKGRTGPEFDVMMRGVLMVVAADGRLADSEQQFVGKLAKAMRMSGEQVQTILHDVVGSAQGQPAE